MKLDDIAQLAGVSRTTASYVINGKAKQYRVSDKTAEKVLAVVREYNYRPNVVAAGLRAGRSRSIGFVMPDLENNSYTRIAKYLEQRARQVDYQLLIACSEDNPDNEIRCVQHLLQRKIDALVISTCLPAHHPFYQQCAAQSLPIIALDRVLDGQHFTSIVGADRNDALTLAREQRKQPLDQLLFFGALPELSVSFLREAGFRQAWQNNLDKVSFLYSDSYQRSQAAHCFSQYLQHHPLPSALFTTSFGLLQGVIDACLQRIGQLPEQLSIATFGDNDMLDFLTCPVLAAGQQHQAIADHLFDTVLNSLDQNCCWSPGITQLERQLVLRGSLAR